MSTPNADVNEQITNLGSSALPRSSSEADYVTPQPWPNEDLSLRRIAAVVLRYRTLALGVAASVAVIGVALVFVSARRPTYTSYASFVPQRSNNSSNLSGLAGIAAQYGVSLDAGKNGESPEFYAALLRSRRLLTAVAESTYRFRNDEQVWSGSLVDLYGGKKKSRAIAKEAALKKLGRDVEASVTRQTGVVQLSVQAKNAELARQIATRLIDELHTYNQKTRQSNAAAERKFIEDRLREKKRELAQSEQELEAFLSRNRQFENSPELRFAHDRQQREVSLQQQVVTSLTESFEEARIEEVRNTPVVTLIETPELAALPNPRGRVKKTLFVLFLSAIAGISVALLAGWLRSESSSISDSNSVIDADAQQSREGVPAPVWREKHPVSAN